MAAPGISPALSVSAAPMRSPKPDHRGQPGSPRPLGLTALFWGRTLGPRGGTAGLWAARQETKAAHGTPGGKLKSRSFQKTSVLSDHSPPWPSQTAADPHNWSEGQGEPHNLPAATSVTSHTVIPSGAHSPCGYHRGGIPKSTWLLSPPHSDPRTAASVPIWPGGTPALTFSSSGRLWQWLLLGQTSSPLPLAALTSGIAKKNKRSLRLAFFHHPVRPLVLRCYSCQLDSWASSGGQWRPASQDHAGRGTGSRQSPGCRSWSWGSPVPPRSAGTARPSPATCHPARPGPWMRLNMTPEGKPGSHPRQGCTPHGCSGVAINTWPTIHTREGAAAWQRQVCIALRLATSADIALPESGSCRTQGWAVR